MKSAICFVSERLLNFATLMFAAGLFTAFPARAGLTVDIHLYHFNQGYYFLSWLSTNATPPNFPTGTYLIASPTYPTSGSWMHYQATNNDINLISIDNDTIYPDLNSTLNAITNGLWSIWVTNSTSTNQYKFRVTAPSLTSNSFGAYASIGYPLNNTLYVTNLPDFAWSGPTNWAGYLVPSDFFVDTNGNYNYFTSASLSPDATNWTPSLALPNGTNSFELDYGSNITALVVASTPTNNAAQAISGWVSTANVQTFDSVLFVVGQPPASGIGGHTNVAYYSFEDNNLFAHDFSGNGNNIASYGNYSMSPYITNDAAAGAYAFGAAGDGWLYPPTNLLATLAGSFSVSLWVKTSEVHGNDNDSIYSAAGIVSALSGGQNTVVPMGLTGSKLAFYTGGGTQDTLYSATSINTGQYVHVVVTRNQQTGEKKIYVNGVLDASDFGSADFLSDATELDVGFNNGEPFTGELDDIQFYSGVLSSNEVLQLYNHPGTTVPDVTGGAANGLDAHYDFDENNVVAPDVSGNGNNIIYAGSFGGSGPAISLETKAGAGSVSFDGGSYLTPTNRLLSTLAGSFTISLWVNTTQDNGDPNDYAFNGDGIISADVPGLANDLVPVALTGGQIAFNTGNPQNGYDDTINSSATVNDGSWHHVVVSRNQVTGEKDIYIDGTLDTSDFDTTNLLNDPQLLTIGGNSDASDPDPASPDNNGYGGYQGLLDDIQIYERVLTPNEVTFLYDNPGATLAGFSNSPSPVSVDFSLSISRQQGPSGNIIYDVTPYIASISPPPVTKDRVESPDGTAFSEVLSGDTYDVNGGRISTHASLDDAIYACTNGQWTLYLNQGDPSQQVFHFNVSINGLTTNLLSAVKIAVPANGAVNVATNTPFQWSGPTNFSYVTVEAFQLPSFNLIGSASFAANATNWPSPPAMPYGTNDFSVTYGWTSPTNITFTTPTDGSLNAVSNWTTEPFVYTLTDSSFVVGAPGPAAVLLTNVMRSSGNIQFSFQTLAGRTNSVLSRTNLAVGSWVVLTNFIGDGSLRQFALPTTNPPVRFFRVITY